MRFAEFAVRGEFAVGSDGDLLFRCKVLAERCEGDLLMLGD